MKDYSWFSSPQHKDTEDQERLSHVAIDFVVHPTSSMAII
jgi:hypothetical protein